jgi:hypothetical protein
MRPYREPKAKSWDDLRVSTVTTTFLPIERNTHTWIAFYVQLYLWITTRAKHAYGDRQYYTRNPPTQEDQPTNEALLPPRTFAWAKCTYGETYPTIEAHLRWEAFPRVKRTLAAIHCAAWSAFFGRDLHNSADRLGWHLRAHLLWTIEVHLSYQWVSTEITLTATEAAHDYYYLRTE